MTTLLQLRRSLFLALVVWSSQVVGCAEPYNGYYSKQIAEGYFGVASEKLKPGAQVLARQRFHSGEDMDKFIFSYLQGYESGLVSIRGTIYLSGSKRDPHNQGFQAGRSAAINDVKAVNPTATLEDFGYTRTEKKGKLRFGFEMAEFLPEESGSVWWVEFTPEMDREYEKVIKADPPLHDRYVFAHLSGFLNPDRGFGVGHFNQYDREFVVSRILELRRFAPNP